MALDVKCMATVERMRHCRETLELSIEVLSNLGIVMSENDTAFLDGHIDAIESALTGIDSILGLVSDIDVDGATDRLVNALARRLGSKSDARESIQNELRHAVTSAADRLLIGHQHEADAYWLRDGNGIELCRVCSLCEPFKRRRYRPEILQPYTQAQVNEPIEPDE